MLDNGYLRKLARKTLFMKKKRSILSIISTMICTTVAVISLCLFVFIFSITNSQNDSVEMYHYTINSQEEIDFSSRYEVFKEYRMDIEMDGEDLYTFKKSDGYFPFVILDGTEPSSSTELIIHKNDGHVGERIGDYQVVGIYDSSFNQHKYTLSENGDLEKYYLRDSSVYLENSYSELIFAYGLNKEDVDCQWDKIQNDTINTYLSSQKFYLLIFILTFVLCIFMSYICIKNIFTITDQSRQKEVGLLKSIGCSPSGIKYYLYHELLILGVIGAFLGMVLGYVLGGQMMSMVASKLYLSFNSLSILNLCMIILGGFCGYLIFFFSGAHTYQNYIHTSPIEDIKEMPFEYGEVNDDSYSSDSVSKQMFRIYNKRMKKQTKNLMQSMLLLMMCAILFSSVFLVSVVYQNNFSSFEFDFILEGNGKSNNELMDELSSMDYCVPIDNLQIERFTFFDSSLSGDVFNHEILDEFITGHNVSYSIKIKHGVETLESVEAYFRPYFMNAKQILEFSDYVVWGSLENVGSKEAVIVLSESNQYGYNLLPSLNNDPYIYLNNQQLIQLSSEYEKEWMVYEKEFYETHIHENAMDYLIKAVVCLPDEAFSEFYFPFYTYPRVVIMDDESVKEIPHRIYDAVRIRLENQYDSALLQSQIDGLLEKYDIDGNYVYENIGMEVVSNLSIVFILEVLMYPIFGLLFVMALMNIYFVLSGNLYLKMNDISILKSLGIKKKELKRMFIYEYLESYFNASLYVVILFAPIAIIQSYIATFEALDLGANMIGSTMISIFVLGPILLVPLVLIHMTQLTSISALPSQTKNIF